MSFSRIAFALCAAALWMGVGPWTAPTSASTHATQSVATQSTVRTFVMKDAYFDTLEGSRCAAGEKRSIEGHEPAGKGSYPLFVYLTGTLMKHDGAEAQLLTREMARRGFVAASVEYDNGDYPYCKGMLDKAQCVWGEAKTDSALTKLCARPEADCDAGIVVAGFSQGANLASLSKNYDARVKGAYLMGHGCKATNINNTPCMRNEATKLESSERRSINAEHDVFFGRTLSRVRKQLATVSGVTCDGTSCDAQDGGWHIVRASELADGKADHCYFFHKANGFCNKFEGFDPGWEKGDQPWSMGPNLDWLAGRVKGDGAPPSES